MPRRRRYASLLTPLLLLPLLSFPSTSHSSTATCPYDLDYASAMIPSACHANSTDSLTTTTSCCWFVYASYLYAAIRHSNHTGQAFLPPSTASLCSSSFSSLLLRRRLVRPSLLLSNSSCTLSASPVPIAAGNLPCQYSTVSAVRSATDLSPASTACAANSTLDLTADDQACQSCQNAVIAAVFDLLAKTNSKEFVACGMAATLALWSPYSPSIPRFRSYALCLLQVLENVGGLSTSNLIPNSTTAAARSPSPSRSGAPRSAKIAAGSAAASIAALAAIAALGFLIRRKRRRLLLFSAVDPDHDPTAAIGSPLPTEGLYIFTKSELKQATNGYDEKLLLGEGGAGKVYLGRLPSGHHVAIKRIYREKKLGEFYREVEILAKLRHRNLTTLVGYCLGKREHVLVYEYMPGGNLSKVLYHGELTWRRRLAVAADVAEGLVYLHEFPEGAVVHRDVKPTNVLLTEGGMAKLSDFGVSRIVPADGSHVSTEIRGTMGYVDPESFSVGHVSEAADVYSFGVVLLELVTGMKAVVPTPSGGAESIVHAAHSVMMEPAARGVGSIVDPRLGAEWDRATVREVFELAYRCVRPYKNERPAMREVLAALKRVLGDLESRTDPSNSNAGEVEAARSTPSRETVSDEGLSAPSTSTTASTPSVHAWSL